MTVQNFRLLQSQEALSSLVESKLSGVYALQVRDIVEEVQERVQRLHEVRKDLAQREDLSEEESNEEWEQVLSEESSIDTGPLPQSALQNAEVSAQDLFALDWMIERPSEEE